MLLGEPPRSQADLHFSLLGIPVRVHWSFWLVAALLGLRRQDPMLLLIWVAAVFVSIVVHELGHALIARVHGAQPWITLYSFGGLASYNPTRHDTTSRILITAAGPGAGFLFAGFLLAAIHASGHPVSLQRVGYFIWPTYPGFDSFHLEVLLGDLLFVNILWGVINLMPIYPLDGGQIARELLVRLNPYEGIRQSLLISIVFAAGMAVFGFVVWGSIFVALMFGYLAYGSYAALQMTSGRGGPFGW